MRSCASLFVCSALVACGATDPESPGEDPAPDAGAVPTPMVVHVGTDVGPGTDVELVEVGRWRGGYWGGDNIYWTEVALQVRLAGTATGPKGAEMRINLSSAEDVAHLGTPAQQFAHQDSTIDIDSDAFTAGSCGSWTDKQVAYDLKCEVPGTAQDPASWTYSEARKFAYVADPVQDTHTFVIDVRAFKNNDEQNPVESDAVACRRIIRTETQENVNGVIQYTRSDTNGPCT